MFRTAALDPEPEPDQPGGVVPPRAAWISALALWVPLYASFLAPDTAGDYEILPWLLALVPAFLLAWPRPMRRSTVPRRPAVTARTFTAPQDARQAEIARRRDPADACPVPILRWVSRMSIM